MSMLVLHVDASRYSKHASTALAEDVISLATNLDCYVTFAANMNVMTVSPQDSLTEVQERINRSFQE